MNRRIDPTETPLACSSRDRGVSSPASQCSQLSPPGPRIPATAAHIHPAPRRICWLPTALDHWSFARPACDARVSQDVSGSPFRQFATLPGVCITFCPRFCTQAGGHRAVPVCFSSLALIADAGQLHASRQSEVGKQAMPGRGSNCASCSSEAS